MLLDDEACGASGEAVALTAEERPGDGFGNGGDGCTIGDRDARGGQRRQSQAFESADWIADAVTCRAPRAGAYRNVVTRSGHPEDAEDIGFLIDHCDCGF